VLGRFVRERALVPLEEAIAKMTGRPAALLGFADRGVLAAGRKADVTMFDAAAIVDNGTPGDPSRPPAGVRHVIVNGQVVLENGTMTGTRPGLGLRRSRQAGSK
jgi:N-acyl-D-aspartate/D-glutamate deacylase